MDKKIRLVIADDHPLLLKGLELTLRTEEDLEIVGTADDGYSAFQKIIELKPDIGILDYEMPGMNGVEVLEKLNAKGSGTKIIFLTIHQGKETFLRAVENGAAGYLLKDTIEDEIVDAVRKVNDGEYYMSPVLSGYLVQRKGRNKSENKIKNLTISEIKVLKMVAANKTTQEIADELFISARTVDRHRSNICKKLNISGHNALIRYVLENRETILGG